MAPDSLAAVFEADEDRSFADVGDGVVGPAGTVSLSLDGLELEFDRADGRLLGVVVDLGEAPPEPPWGELFPDLERLRQADGQLAEGRLELPSTFLDAAHHFARIDTECLRGAQGDEAPALEPAALLEVLPYLRAIDQHAPGVYGGKRGIRRMAERARASWGNLTEDERDALRVGMVDPVRAATFARLAQAAADVDDILVDLAVELRGVPEPPAEQRAARTPPTPQPIARGTAGPPSGNRPQPVVLEADGTFVVNNPVVSLRGRLEPISAGTAYEVRIEDVTRRVADTYGPLWIRLFQGGEVIAGQPFDVDGDSGGAAFSVPVGAGQQADHAEAWVNPWRYQTLRPPRPIQHLVADAYKTARTALARSWPDPDADEWNKTGELWLSAGFLDRAALAFAYAANPAQWIWIRSPAARARLENGNRLWQPRCYAWKRPDDTPQPGLPRSGRS